MSGSLKVFLCHGSEDKPTIRSMFSRLREDGVDAWLDEQKILPGQDWQMEIRKAVRSSDAILVCLSSHSVRKESFLQKEIKFALDVADEKPEGTIFIIPVKLDDCQLPSRLRHWQWVNYFEGIGYQRILGALRSRAAECGIGNMPGTGPLVRVDPPVDETSQRVLYKAADIRSLLQRYMDGDLLEEDVPLFPAETIVSITNEAMNESLNRFSDDDRRAEEKRKLLRLVGISSLYREWQEASTKNHCFRNEFEHEDSSEMIERVPVKSSNISTIGYDAQKRTLEVEFRSGSIYRYFEIPSHIHAGLMKASSHGSYLDLYVKKGGYAYEQIKK
jgi:hypothetical protein